MKLYTEEQVKYAIQVAFDVEPPCKVKDILRDLTPIELPTDEEVEAHSYIIADHFENPNDTNYNGLRLGAVRMSWWIMDKIKGGQGEN